MVFVGVASGLSRCFGSVELSDQVREAVRHALPHHVVVHGAKLMANSGLNLRVETALRLYFLHDLIHASPRVKSLHLKYFFENQALAVVPLLGS